MPTEGSPYGREALKGKGWCQGSLLPAPTAIRPTVWVSPAEQGWTKARKDVVARKRRGDVAEPFLYERPARASDRLALITQECDVLKPPDEFPIVEFALVLETTSEAVLREANSLTSARYFRLGEASPGVPVSIVDFRFRAQADKGFLVEHSPDNALVFEMSEARRGTLREWLGRRLGREAVSDDDTRLIVEPIREAWKTLSNEEAATASRWGAMVSELRFRHAENSRLRLYVITHDEVDSGDADLLEMAEWVVEQLDWSEPLVDVTLTNEWAITVGEHRSTHEIDLAWASYEEDQEEAA